MTPKKSQARKNIDAAPAGYGWGDSKGKKVSGYNGNLDDCTITGLYYIEYAGNVKNLPDRNCEAVVVWTPDGNYPIFQTAYCEDGRIAVRRYGEADGWSAHWSEWRWIDEDNIKSPQTAEVGQVLAVKSVNANGEPTEWEVINAFGQEDIDNAVLISVDDIDEIWGTTLEETTQ